MGADWCLGWLGNSSRIDSKSFCLFVFSVKVHGLPTMFHMTCWGGSVGRSVCRPFFSPPQQDGPAGSQRRGPCEHTEGLCPSLHNKQIKNWFSSLHPVSLFLSL